MPRNIVSSRTSALLPRAISIRVGVVGGSTREEWLRSIIGSRYCPTLLGVNSYAVRCVRYGRQFQVTLLDIDPKADPDFASPLCQDLWGIVSFGAEPDELPDNDQQIWFPSEEVPVIIGDLDLGVHEIIETLY